MMNFRAMYRVMTTIWRILLYGNMDVNATYSIDYLIGDTDYMPQILKKLKFVA